MHKVLKKLLSLFITFSLILPYFYGYDNFFLSANDSLLTNLKRKKLIAVLVDDRVYVNRTVRLEIKKWAARIWKRVENSNTIIYRVLENEDPSSIYEKLEHLYFDWEIWENYESYLDWVVLVWNIHLPTVQVRDNTSLKESIFPFTDFVNKYFVFDKSLWHFTRQNEVTTPKAEIWHWIIRPREWEIWNISFYQNYFKKLNSFYAWGVKHQDKILFADLDEENKFANKDLLKQYLKIPDFDFRIAYKKFSSEMLSEISDEFWWEIKETKEVKLNPKFLDVSIDNDIFAKNQISKLLPRFSDVLKWYIEKVNDLTEITWRWSGGLWDTAVKLITIKDEISRTYIKSINEIYQNQIIKFVEKKWQNQIKVYPWYKKAEDCSKVRWTPKDKYFSKQVLFSSLNNDWTQSTEPVDIWWIPIYTLCKIPNRGEDYVSISSLIVHNEPSGSTIDFLTSSPRVMTIPIDWRHLLSFKWNKWEVVIFLPNLFNAKNLSGYLDQYNQYLQNALRKDWESWRLQNLDYIANALGDTFNEYAHWRTLNVNEKYKEILLEHWFWKNVKTFDWKRTAPYELFYLRSSLWTWDWISFKAFFRNWSRLS